MSETTIHGDEIEHWLSMDQIQEELGGYCYEIKQSMTLRKVKWSENWFWWIVQKFCNKYFFPWLFNSSRQVGGQQQTIKNNFSTH